MRYVLLTFWPRLRKKQESLLYYYRRATCFLFAVAADKEQGVKLVR